MAKAKRKNVQSIDPAIDLGSAMRHRHGRVVIEGRQRSYTRDGKEILTVDPDGQRVIRARETEQKLIDSLYVKGMLRTAQEGEDEADRRYTAAAWLWETFNDAGLQDSGTCNFGPRSGGGGDSNASYAMDDYEDAAMNRYLKAMRAMGPVGGLVQGVVCFDKSPGQWLQTLRAGLDTLAKHRGIE